MKNWNKKRKPNYPKEKKKTCSRVDEWALSWRARAALEAREWAWRWGRRWEMSGGGNLRRRSWIRRVREEAFWSNSWTYFCWSGEKINGILLKSSSWLLLPPWPPTTSAAHANSPAISLSQSFGSASLCFRIGIFCAKSVWFASNMKIKK